MLIAIATGAKRQSKVTLPTRSSGMVVSNNQRKVKSLVMVLFAVGYGNLSTPPIKLDSRYEKLLFSILLGILFIVRYGFSMSV